MSEHDNQANLDRLERAALAAWPTLEAPVGFAETVVDTVHQAAIVERTRAASNAPSAS